MSVAEQLYAAFENYRQQHGFHFQPDALYEPIRYMLDLGGKRMRPMLTLLGCRLFGGKTEDALPAAYAVELFHNFTLMHDDIMDHAPLRRGKPTVHEKYNAARAILSGDAMLIYAYRHLGKMHPSGFARAFELFNDTAVKVCEGQQLDMNFQTAQEVSQREYLTMIEYKTAVLLGCSLQSGAIAANAPEKDAQRVYEFGKHIGICFQLMDDLLDSFGDEKSFGKKIGGDIAENKKTFLVIKALEQARGDDREKLLFYLNNNVPADEKVKQVLSLFRKLDIEAEARKEAEKFHRLAMSSLDEIDAPAENKSVLTEYADSLLRRKT